VDLTLEEIAKLKIEDDFEDEEEEKNLDDVQVKELSEEEAAALFLRDQQPVPTELAEARQTMFHEDE